MRKPPRILIPRIIADLRAGEECADTAARPLAQALSDALGAWWWSTTAAERPRGLRRAPMGFSRSRQDASLNRVYG